MNGFSRTLRAIEREPTRLYAWLAAGLTIATLVWGGWLVFARTTLFVLSEAGRLEATGNPMPVQAPVDGVVVESGLTLGRIVAEGEVLFRLDAKPFELQRSEASAQLVAHRANLEALREQLRAEEEARDATARNVNRSTRAAGAKVAVAASASRSRKRESEMVKRLAEESLASRLENLRVLADAEQSQAEERASRADAALQASSGETTLRDRDVRIAVLGQALAEAEGALKIDEARVATLSYEIERRVVRAAAAGTLADIVPLPIGTTLSAASFVATVVPTGEIRVVARFAPREAIGRVAPGQTARVRVENFPWTQYGTLGATVVQVGSEPRDGTVRVELAVTGPNERIPLTHGLTGSVEVEIEQLSPLELLLRLAGQKLAPGRGAATSRDSSPLVSAR